MIAIFSFNIFIIFQAFAYSSLICIGLVLVYPTSGEVQDIDFSFQEKIARFRRFSGLSSGSTSFFNERHRRSTGEEADDNDLEVSESVRVEERLATVDQTIGADAEERARSRTRRGLYTDRAFDEARESFGRKKRSSDNLHAAVDANGQDGDLEIVHLRRLKRSPTKNKHGGKHQTSSYTSYDLKPSATGAVDML